MATVCVGDEFETNDDGELVLACPETSREIRAGGVVTQPGATIAVNATRDFFVDFTITNPNPVKQDGTVCPANVLLQGQHLVQLRIPNGGLVELLSDTFRTPATPAPSFGLTLAPGGPGVAVRTHRVGLNEDVTFPMTTLTQTLRTRLRVTNRGPGNILVQTVQNRVFGLIVKQ